MRFQAPRGTEDVLPVDSHKWRRLESEFVRCVDLFGYQEIRTPTFEDAQLFLRTAGETSDVVSKQMYDFFDKGDRHIALKAEGTAPAMRAMIEHGLLQAGTVHRIFYNTPVFRYERPQKGRLREHHQVGIELIGSSAVEADAEVIAIAVQFYERLGLADFELRINSIGRSECRDKYRAAILEFCQPWLANQEAEARAKAEANPLRLLDSKDPELQKFMAHAPSIQDYLEPECAQRFESLQRLLSDDGIQFQVDSRIVRGLDYYTETVFELQIESIGAQSAIGGGGRYDGLIGQLGGPPIPSVGFGIGIERALLALESKGIVWERGLTGVFVASAGESHVASARRIAGQLRGAGIPALYDFEGRSLKSQLKQADKLGFRYVAILGDEESATGTVSLRDLSTSTQSSVGVDELLGALLS